METFDLIVLGGGPAGYNAAERAAAAGLKTLVAEKRALGGVCLNEGCIPSKALLYAAKVYDYTKHSTDYGVTVTGSSIDQKAVVARKDKVVKTLVGGIGATMKKLGVTVLNTEAVITGKTAEGVTVEADGKTYTGKNLLIATGSAPVVPPIPGLRENLETGFVLTNREVLDLPEIPAEMTVIGGGVIGLEMASYYNSVGSHVTVIEMLDHIAGPTDADISKILLDNYKKKGIDFKLGCAVTAVEPGTVRYKDPDGKECAVKADKVLCAIGRRAVTAGIGLETLGVLTERGAIVTDEQMRTNIPGVYAAGDVNGKSMLAHTAYREGEVAVNTILGKKDRMRYHAIPSVIYTNPEVGSVGETEATAKAKGLDVEIVTLPMMYSGRYVAEGGKDGIVKVIADKQYHRILGVHMIGNYASEIIYGGALMIETETRVADLREIVFPHPTVCEVIREALFEIK